MYAIVKTGGKQYRVAPGDTLNVEKLPGEVGDKLTLDAVCIVDGKKVEANPSKAKATKVEAVIVEQFKDKKILVFKFKKRKNYKRLQGHRQNLTRIQITAVGSEKAAAPKAEKKASAEKASTKTTAKAADAKTSKASEKKTTSTKKSAASKTTAKADAAEKKATPKKKTQTTKATAEKSAKSAEKKADTADEASKE